MCDKEGISDSEELDKSTSGISDVDKLDIESLKLEDEVASAPTSEMSDEKTLSSSDLAEEQQLSSLSSTKNTSDVDKLSLSLSSSIDNFDLESPGTDPNPASPDEPTLVAVVDAENFQTVISSLEKAVESEKADNKEPTTKSAVDTGSIPLSPDSSVKQPEIEKNVTQAVVNEPSLKEAIDLEKIPLPDDSSRNADIKIPEVNANQAVLERIAGAEKPNLQVHGMKAGCDKSAMHVPAVKQKISKCPMLASLIQAAPATSEGGSNLHGPYVAKLRISEHATILLERKTACSDDLFNREFSTWRPLFSQPPAESEREVSAEIRFYILNRTNSLQRLLNDCKYIRRYMDDANRHRHEYNTECSHEGIFCKKVPYEWSSLIRKWTETYDLVDSTVEAINNVLTRCKDRYNNFSKENIDSFTYVLLLLLDSLDQLHIILSGSLSRYKRVGYRFDDYLFIQAIKPLERYLSPAMQKTLDEHDLLMEFECSLRKDFGKKISV